MRMRRGQAAVEYVLALAAMLVVLVAMGYVVAAAVRASHRTTRIVRADYP